MIPKAIRDRCGLEHPRDRDAERVRVLCPGRDISATACDESLGCIWFLNIGVLKLKDEAISNM